MTRAFTFEDGVRETCRMKVVVIIFFQIKKETNKNKTYFLKEQLFSVFREEDLNNYEHIIEDLIRLHKHSVDE